jgi:hypothetical protein
MQHATGYCCEQRAAAREREREQREPRVPRAERTAAAGAGAREEGGERRGAERGRGREVLASDGMGTGTGDRGSGERGAERS